MSPYQRVFEVHESPVIHSKPPLLEALCVLWQSKRQLHFEERKNRLGTLQTLEFVIRGLKGVWLGKN